jgi:glycosyltransferase involved in cell wall biosynthesis
MSHSHKIPVTFFFRKPQAQYFSIEKVFEQVIKHMPQTVQAHVYHLKNGTTGWWGRLKALLEVWRHKGSINHITGDITFIALALPKKGLIVTYHDLESLRQYKGCQFRILKFLWVTIPVKRARVVTAISQHTKEQLIKWTGVDEKKIVVIPNPVPDEVEYAPKTFDAQNPTVLLMGT